MAEETYSFDQARVRLEEIAVQVRKKDISLEKSLDLLEEGVRLANLCTEQIDQTQWRSVIEEAARAEAEAAADGDAGGEAAPGAETPEPEPCEEPEGGGALETAQDVPVEDSHGAAEEPPVEDPDVED